MNIAEKLVKLRKEKGLTQEKLAQELNISIASIKNYENVKTPREPKNDILLKFAEFYNVSTEYLLNDDITNKTTDNITIENKLNLSDKTIEKIVEINTKVNSAIIGKFIDFLPINDFWGKIDEYIELNKEINKLLPLIGVSKKYSMVFEKYSTDDTIYNYSDNKGIKIPFGTLYPNSPSLSELLEMEIPDEDRSTIDMKAFYNNNKCMYSSKDKETMFELFNIFENNDILSRHFKHLRKRNYADEISEVKDCINNNSKIPDEAISMLLPLPEMEIEARKERKETILFYLSKELNNFFTYLDKEEQEAE